MVISDSKKSQKLAEDMLIVKQIILENLPADCIQAIILYGSYGRGEGAFYILDELLYTYNDYDLMLITDSKIDKEILGSIKSKIKDKINIKYIDLSYLSIAKLKKLKPSIFNFDLKYGSKVLWGDEQIFDFIPSFNSEDINLKDAEKLYFTRLFTFLGSLNENAFKTGVEEESSRFFRNQMAKALLAIVDIKLIQKGEYHTSYKERVKRFVNMHPENRSIVDHVKWALEEKLNPKKIAMNANEVSDFYSEVLGLFIDKMFEVLSIYYGARIQSTDDILYAKPYSFNDMILRMKLLVKTKSYETYRRLLNINMAQSYVAESYTLTGEKRNRALEKCRVIIKKYLPGKNVENASWNQLRMLTAELRLKGV